MPQRKRTNSAAGFGKTRSLRELRRTGGTKEPSRSLLIVCEGAKTEKLYFNSLVRSYRLSTIEVTVIGEGEAPISVVDRALALRREQVQSARKSRGGDVRSTAPYDEVWCVFDTEQFHHNPSFFPAVDKARANDLKLAISNPAFEFWLLLHFRFTTRSFNAVAEVIADLRVHIVNYEKGADCFSYLAQGIGTAIDYARRIRDRAPEDELFPHPSTTVYQLVEVLDTMKRR